MSPQRRYLGLSSYGKGNLSADHHMAMGSDQESNHTRGWYLWAAILVVKYLDVSVFCLSERCMPVSLYGISFEESYVCRLYVCTSL